MTRYCLGILCSGLLLAITGCGGGGGGSAPPPPQPSATLSSSTASVPPGGSATLTWSSTNATTCTGSGGVFAGAKNSSGTQSVGPHAATTDYTINCGGAIAGVSVVVAPAPVLTFNASSPFVQSGGNATLTWSVTNATACVASGAWSGARAASGTQQVGPVTAAATYTLTCGIGTNTDSKSVAIDLATVAGRLLVAPLTQTDGDTNDTVRTPAANDSFDTAQSLPNPVIVGGYAALPNRGSPGPLLASGDRLDTYKISLAANQTIELHVAAPAEGDLDLTLYDSTRTLRNASTGTGTTERITATTAGEYFVQVVAYAGSSNYVLSIGQIASTATVSSGFTLSDDFVPGELLAKIAATTSSALGNEPLELRSKVALEHGLKIETGAPGTFSKLTLNADSAVSYDKMQADTIRFASERDRHKFQTLYAVKSLRNDPNVAWAEPNYLFRPSAVPNDPRYTEQRWHYELIRAPQAWDITTGNGNVIAAVIDSGVRPHPDIAPRFVGGYDFVSELVNAGDGNGRDNDPADPGEPPTQGGRFTFHGTHVAGTIGAIGNNGTGVTGVGWNVRIMPIRAIGIETGNSIDIVNGMLYAARLPNIAGVLPAQRADVMNLSLGSIVPMACPQAWQDVINQVRAAGVIVVAAAGNESSQATIQPVSSPANCNGVIAVTAVNRLDQRTSYSNAGAAADIAAPGGEGATGNVFSTHASFDGQQYFATYDFLAGTSMAAPHVAGVIALMKSVNPALTPVQVDALLAAGAMTDDIGPAGPDALGIGRLNAMKAVMAAQVGTPPARPGQLSLVPTTLSFGDVATTNSVAVGNAGTQAVSVTQVVASAPWLAATADPASTGGLGTYRVTVNRTGLSPGTYVGTVEFRGSTGAAVRTNVQMQVSTAAVVPDAGQHYVLLINPATGATVEQVEVNARGASVGFAFPTVASGAYLLAVGTDADNDGFICDDGEACGEFPIFGEASPVQVSPTAFGLDVATEYGVSIRATTASHGDATSARSGFRRLR